MPAEKVTSIGLRMKQVPENDVTGGGNKRRPWLERYQVVVACVLTLAGTLVVSFLTGILAIDDQIETLEDRLDRVEYELKSLNEDVEGLTRKVETIDDKLDRILFALARQGVNLAASAP